MTETNITEQFFKVFGIEKQHRYVVSHNGHKYNCDKKGMLENKHLFSTHQWTKVEKVYKQFPIITNDILLKLICFNNSHWTKLEDLICPKNIITIKEDVLKRLLKRDEEYKYGGYEDGFWHVEIRSLFEEVE